MTFTEFVIQRQTCRNFDTSSGSDRLTDRLTDASTNPYVQTGREVAKFDFRLWRGVLSDKLFLTVYLVVAPSSCLAGSAWVWSKPPCYSSASSSHVIAYKLWRASRLFRS